jgi:hypothetical protein
MQKHGILLILPVLCLGEVCLAAGVTVAPSSIAAGSPQWVASAGDKSPTDAMVDIGTMRQTGDALEVDIRWPHMPASYGPELAEKDRVVCLEDHAISFAVEDGFVSADGEYHIKQTYDPARRREEAERQDSQMPKIGAGFSSYGPDPRSMACWAAARKCAGEPFTWPPPPNRTPLENTAEALKMNSDYNKPFVPTCTLN